MTDKTCSLSLIDGTCATHPGTECGTQTLSPAPAQPAEPKTKVHDLPIYKWARGGKRH